MGRYAVEQLDEENSTPELTICADPSVVTGTIPSVSFALRHKAIYKCKECMNHIFSSNKIISEDFRGKYGSAYFVNEIHNVKTGESETRQMVSGAYVVSDVYCKCCGNYLGWKYLTAAESEESYKVGKFVVELYELVRDCTKIIDNNGAENIRTAI